MCLALHNIIFRVWGYAISLICIYLLGHEIFNVNPGVSIYIYI